jgi:hypothetical protein
MENDPIILLREAIEDLTMAVRSMRSASLDGACNKTRSREHIDSSEIADSILPISNETALGPEGITPNHEPIPLVTNLNEDVEKAQQELDQLVLALGEKDAKLEVARNAIIATQKSLEELEERKAQLTIRVEEFEQKKKQLEILQDERASLEEHLRVVKAETSDIDLKSKMIAAREEELRLGIEQVKHSSELLSKLWPKWLCGEDLRNWKELIERDAFAENSPPSFCLLFAAIHNYTASLRDTDHRILLDALRDLGRRLYQWLKDLGKSEESNAEVVEVWAMAINNECEGRCSIQVAIPGNPANNKWMNFIPRGGSSPDVASVRSWCVSDNQGRPIHRAEITV